MDRLTNPLCYHKCMDECNTLQLKTNQCHFLPYIVENITVLLYETRIGLAQFIVWVNPNLYSNPCLVLMPTFAPNFEDFIPEVQMHQPRERCTSHT